MAVSPRDVRTIVARATVAIATKSQQQHQLSWQLKIMKMTTKTKKSVLNKKYPTNPKYQHVKAQVDSGATIRKYVEHLEELHRNFKLSKDEIFRRIKLESFVRLIIEVGLNNLRTETDNDEEDGEKQISESRVSSASSLEMSTDGSEATDSPRSRVTTARSTLHSVVSGIGELDLNEEVKQKPSTVVLPQNSNTDLPYLLLDVRDRDYYNQSHIISAVNYPHTMISRAMNYETQDLLSFVQNEEKLEIVFEIISVDQSLRLRSTHAILRVGCIIVVYDDDEILSQKVVITLVQRGYDNIYLLSGGLKLASQKFKDGFIWKETQQVDIETRNRFNIIDIQNLQKSIDFYLMSTTSKNFLKSGQRTISSGESGSVYRKTTKGQNEEEQQQQQKGHNLKPSSLVTTTTERSSFSSLSRKPWK